MGNNCLEVPLMQVGVFSNQNESYWRTKVRVVRDSDWDAIQVYRDANLQDSKVGQIRRGIVIQTATERRNNYNG